MTWDQPQPKTFYDVSNSSKRFIINQGGSRSGKTYSILQCLIKYAYQNRLARPTVVTICRKTLPSIKGTVLRDFIEILHGLSWYDEEQHNKTENMYQLFNTTFEFVAVDQPQKIRGRKRDICYINEANELTYEDFRQLNMRTSQKVIIDFNPSEEYWAHTELREKYSSDVDFFITNYTHNPFIDPAVKTEIERLKDIDENYWRIYGLGELGMVEGLIFPRWSEISAMPDDLSIFYGLDFGYSNDPTALIQCAIKGDELYLREIIYQTGLTNTDIIHHLDRLGINQNHEIIADSAEPKSIEEIYRQGYNIKPAVKGRDSIMHGINLLKQYKLHVTSDSLNLIKELRNYKWISDKNGNFVNQPIDYFNHAIDAVRYAVSLHSTVRSPAIRVL